ncbi:unnamed protein product [Soboliphyme baturini]|uniref:Secreted protein n=1 Tax=Soboliphyme baturini TaxID=241478 RepID=A0A183INT2_9BILA|nr:unnamed protein product [Soboliphyme baturini]
MILHAFADAIEDSLLLPPPSPTPPTVCRHQHPAAEAHANDSTRNLSSVDAKTSRYDNQFFGSSVVLWFSKSQFTKGCTFLFSHLHSFTRYRRLFIHECCTCAMHNPLMPIFEVGHNIA